ncbi:SAM-dependent methyltransferase [Parafrankia discariae]|uniref:SAM-dependent methyltransferase n=1 Tax=Parafrankia discariae TaxID=365528 RepID=UPI00047584A2|nr:SAM-dependent methyltransferase [Parafrankia discariae]
MVVPEREGLCAVTDAEGGAFSVRPWFTPVAEQLTPVDLKTDVPHSARVYDYFLGGKDNFPADREAAEQTLAIFPDMRTGARENRAFLHRATRKLVGELGLRQFLDIGTGIPTSPNLHEVAQEAAADARIVYADNDPIVLAHARALLTGTRQGRTAYLDADLREPEKILASPELADTLDLGRPFVLSLIAVLHFIPASDDPYGLVRRYTEILPSGSYVALTHATGDFAPEEAERVSAVYQARGITLTPRSRAEVEDFLTGLDLVEPGVVPVHRWHAEKDAGTELADSRVNVYGAIARVP